jgi:hypothetical protein
MDAKTKEALARIMLNQADMMRGIALILESETVSLHNAAQKIRTIALDSIQWQKENLNG